MAMILGMLAKHVKPGAVNHRLRIGQALRTFHQEFTFFHLESLNLSVTSVLELIGTPIFITVSCLSGPMAGQVSSPGSTHDAAKRVYPDRTLGRHRHHRGSHWPAVAGRAKGSRS